MKDYPIQSGVKVGQPAKLYSDMSFFGRPPSFKCNATVVYVTATIVAVETDHGVVSRFRRATGRAVGYSESICIVDAAETSD